MSVIYFPNQEGWGRGMYFFFFWSRWETSIIFNEVGDLKDIAHLIKYI